MGLSWAWQWMYRTMPSCRSLLPTPTSHRCSEARFAARALEEKASAAKVLHCRLGFRQGWSEMPATSVWLNGKEAATFGQFHRRVLMVACLSLCGVASGARASELVIGPEALQTLVAASVFKDQGRWDLAKGKCY